MNWAWPSKSTLVLTDNANSAENRLKAIKRAAKALKKSVEESLRTKSKNEDVEVRKRKTSEFTLGENVALAVQSLVPEGNVDIDSPFNAVMDRFASFEKNIGKMLATNEMEITAFLSSDTPLSKLLNKDIPAISTAKRDLDLMKRRQAMLQASYDKEMKKLQKMCSEVNDDLEVTQVRQQEEKTRTILHEVEGLSKDVNAEEDKLTTLLLTLVSRENHYASSVVELMRIKKQFYANAFAAISSELPDLERILQETTVRPMFGEDLGDHLKATKRKIAFPVALSVTFLRKSGLDDEGLFRISTQQIKLEKLKAHLDANRAFLPLLQGCDAHFFAALLKSYLRELPVPLLGQKEPHVCERWLAVPTLPSKDAKVREIRYILKENLSPLVVVNIQYMVKFLSELSKKSDINKMTSNNLGIVIGPSMLWSNHGSAASQPGNIERIIKVVAFLVDCYADIFPVDIRWDQFDEGITEIIEALNHLPLDEDASNLQPKVQVHASGEASAHHRISGKMSSLRTIFSKFNNANDGQEPATLLSHHPHNHVKERTPSQE